MVNPLETILLVHDEDTGRRYGSRVLQTHGFEVLSAATGTEALATAEQHGGPIALLLSDVTMPGINGCDLAARMLHRQPWLRILFISGYAEDALADQLYSVGQAAFLGTPFKPKALVTRVREVLDAPASDSHGHVGDI